VAAPQRGSVLMSAALAGARWTAWPLRDKGRIAAERLLGALTDDRPPADVELLPTRLVIRDSTAPPNAQRSAT